MSSPRSTNGADAGGSSPPRAGDVRDTLADVSRAWALIGYVPTIDFREGLRRTLEATSTVGA
jgi:nucleoside-diphosphate-sugar epimerase